ncbi:hypothetical protein ABT160_22685 [Streptomyces sp. NPDC001941]|uniref:hypothetical protein n=1 Tax=Streptomyces sp. NPDC001941 TaxID=3154659 RepID=UPI003316CA98
MTNPLVTAIAEGRAPLAALAALAMEQRHVIPADRTSFRHLARRSSGGVEYVAFFDFFGRPAPELERLTRSALEAGVARGRVTEAAPRYQSLLGTYESMFWETLAGVGREQ